MFGLHRPHKGELPLVTSEGLSPDAWELARFWINGERSLVVTGVEERWSPELMGSLLLECARTAATAYAHAGSMSEDEAWARILKGLDEERQRLSRSGDKHDHE